MSQIETYLGVAGFFISSVLLVLRLWEFLENRVRFQTDVSQTVDYFGDNNQEDNVYQLVVTNQGGRPVTIRRLEVSPYKRRAWFFKQRGISEDFITSEGELGFDTLTAGASKKYVFPFHDLSWAMKDVFYEEETGKKPPKRDGMLCRIHHNRSKRPQTVILE